MSNDSTTNNPTTTTPAPDAVQQLLQGSNPNGQALSPEQRNDRREALLKRQREAREKAQQLSQEARAAASSNASSSTSPSTTATTPSSSPSSTTPAAPKPSSPAPTAVVAPVSDAPVRENMVQQAVSFLSSPSVQSADEAKKTQFLEKKGLTLKEIELARARVAGTASAPSAPAPAQAHPPAASYSNGPAPPPVPPRTYAPAQAYPQQQPMYMVQQPQQIAVDPNAFKRKLAIALLISGGVTVLTSVIVQKLIYPMVRGITGARQSLAVSQTEILAKLKEKLAGYKDYLLGLNLGSNRAPVKKIQEAKTNATKTTVEDEDESTDKKKTATTTTTTTTTATTTITSAVATTTAPHLSTVKQLDAFSKTLENHSNKMNFEQLKATRAMTQDLAEYITKETYALTTSIAYPTSRYYGYNTAGAAASGKGGLADPTTPESALKSEIRSLKGLLLNWRNFPVAKEGAAPGSPGLPNLVQQQ